MENNQNGQTEAVGDNETTLATQAAPVTSTSPVNSAPPTSPTPPASPAPPTPRQVVINDIDAIVACLDDAPGAMFDGNAGLIVQLQKDIIAGHDRALAADAMELCSAEIRKHAPAIMQPALIEQVHHACTIPVAGFALLRAAQELDVGTDAEQHARLEKLVCGTVAGDFDKQEDIEDKQLTMMGEIHAAFQTYLKPPMGVTVDVFDQLLASRRRVVERAGKERWAKMCEGEVEGACDLEALIASIKFTKAKQGGKNGMSEADATMMVWTPEGRRDNDPVNYMRGHQSKVPLDTLARAAAGHCSRNPEMKFFYVPGRDGTTYYFLADGEIVEISDRSMQFAAWMSRRTGVLNHLGGFVNTVANALKLHAHAHGVRCVSTPSWTHFNPDTETLYIHGNQERRDVVYRVSPKGVETMMNGDGDVILARGEGESAPFVYEKTDHKKSAELLRKHVVDKYAFTRLSERLFSLCHGTAAFLRRATIMRPGLLINGDSESGKTFAGLHTASFTCGTYRAVDPTVASMYSTSQNRMIFVLDNLEKLTPEMENLLMVGQTGGFREKRSRNTDHGVTSEGMDSIIIITAIVPKSREEIRNRMFKLTTTVDAWEADSANPGQKKAYTDHVEHDLVVHHRDELLSYVLDVISESVLPHFKRKYEDECARIRALSTGGKAPRAISYLALMSLIMRGLSKEMGFEPSVILKEWVEQQQESSIQDRSEGSDVVEGLDLIMATACSGVEVKMGAVQAAGVWTKRYKDGEAQMVMLRGTPTAFLQAIRSLKSGYQPTWNSTTWGIKAASDWHTGVLERKGWNCSRQRRNYGELYTFTHVNDFVDMENFSGGDINQDIYDGGEATNVPNGTGGEPDFSENNLFSRPNNKDPTLKT